MSGHKIAEADRIPENSSDLIERRIQESCPDLAENNATCSKKQKTKAPRAHFVQPEVQDDLDGHDSSIVIEPAGEGSMNVRLGFLQVMHVYDVQFSIEDDLGEDITFDPLENIHAKIESVSPSEDGKGHDLVLTFSALKEKIMQEAVTVTSKSDPSKKVVLVLHARVLGKGKGTPSLKKGIHCVRIEWDEETDDSDWQGF